MPGENIYFSSYVMARCGRCTGRSAAGWVGGWGGLGHKTFGPFFKFVAVVTSTEVLKGVGVGVGVGVACAECGRIST